PPTRYRLLPYTRLSRSRAIAIRRRQLVPPEIGDITPTQVSDITPPRSILHEIERRSFHPRRKTRISLAVKQGEIQRRDGIIVGIDRKSTRLNSSHAKIS